jgi:ligand-binding SRPBCC domain-containing protein
MPVFEVSQTFPGRPEDVFDFFTCPANLLAASPPELHLRLEEAPERLGLGARVRVRGRRWGVPHRVVSEVTVFEPGVQFVEEQRQGPFRRWVHTHRFEALAGGGVCVRDHIDFEPPGGILGLTVTAAFVLRDLKRAFAYRHQKLAEKLGAIGETAR